MGNVAGGDVGPPPAVDVAGIDRPDDRILVLGTRRREGAVPKQYRGCTLPIRFDSNLCISPISISNSLKIRQVVLFYFREGGRLC